jgi:hypothetical protein
MRIELDEHLCRTYPTLYQERQSDNLQSLVGWGFACGDGWYALIDTLSALLIRHAPDTRALQVKEKFGGLRFYYMPSNDYSRGVVTMAEAISLVTCELCGAPAATYEANRWLVTRCPAHVESCHVGGQRRGLAVSSVYGLGLGWSRLVVCLEEAIAQYAERCSTPKATLEITVKNSRLSVLSIGGDARTTGMVDFVNHYVARIDERNGWPLPC